MTIYLYSISDDPIKMQKTLPTEYRTVSGTLRDAGDIGRPVVEVEGDASAYNYMYIPIFGRYYFLDPPVRTVTGLTLLSGRTDVLMSFATDIRALPAIPARTADPDTADWYLHDARQPVRAYRSIITRPGVDMAYDLQHYLLLTAG